MDHCFDLAGFEVVGIKLIMWVVEERRECFHQSRPAKSYL